MNPLLCTSYTQDKWDGAVAGFNQLLIPAEESIASKLRDMFGGLKGQPNQLLREFQKYGALIKRGGIVKSLESEKQVMVGQLNMKLKTAESEL
jgi:dynein heavy chain 2